MKKIYKILIPTIPFLSLPIIASCGTTKVPTYAEIKYKHTFHFEKRINCGAIYYKEKFSFDFELIENTFIDFKESYVRIGYENYKLNSEKIKYTQEGNKFIFTVDGDIVVNATIVIYVSTYRKFSLTLNESSSDFTFDERFTPEVLENVPYVIGFKTKENRIVDLDKTAILVDGKPIKMSDCEWKEEKIGEIIYDFIRIPGSNISGNLNIKLVSSEAYKTKCSDHPEYTTEIKSKIKKDTDFYCQFVFIDKEKWALNADKAIIKVNGNVLSPDKYELDITNSFLKIKKENINGDIDIDIPPIRCFNCYPCKFRETPTVIVTGDRAILNKQYSFKVKAKDSAKTIDFEDENSYITIGTKKLIKNDTLESGKFTAEEDTATKEWTITIDKTDVVDDIYCHFITK